MDIEKDLKMYFEQQTSKLPDNLDFHNRKIESRPFPRRNHVPVKLLLTLALLIAISGSSIVYGSTIVSYIKNLDFFNSNGDTVWSISTSEESRSYEDIVDATLAGLNLAPGEAVSIYVKEDNPDNIVVDYQEPLVIEDINQFNSYHINQLDYSFAPELLQKYEFRTGTVTFDTIMSNENFALILEEAKTTDQNVIVKNLEVSSEVASLAGDYYSKEDSDGWPAFNVRMVKWHGNDLIHTSDENGIAVHDYEKIMLGDSEVLYRELYGRKEINWIESGIYYIISSNQKSMTKEELLNITKALALR